MIALAASLALLPLRIAVRLGLRGTVVAVCLLVLAVLGYGIAGDLGLLDPPANAAAGLSRTARADIPPQYRRRYQRAARRCPGLPWTVLAAVGKVESDHGRARLPGVRAGANPAGAAGPMQLGVGGKAGPTWQHYRVDADGDGASVYDPDDATAAAADKLCADGAPRHLDAALYAYNPSWAYVTRVNRWAARYTSGGGGRR